MEIFEANDHSKSQPKGIIVFALESNHPREDQEVLSDDSANHPMEQENNIIASNPVAQPDDEAVIVAPDAHTFRDPSTPDHQQTQTEPNTFSLVVTGMIKRFTPRQLIDILLYKYNV